MKKIVKSLLMLALLLIGVCFVNVDGNTVLAAESETEYMTEQVELSTLDESKIPVCTDTTKEWLFAGWYEDAACEVAYRSFPTDETAYAKFVPEKVLSVKLQLTKGTDGGSKNTNMRLVSSVDSLDYRKVGFKVYFNNAKDPVNIETTKVYERIVASETSGVDYNYSPKVVDTKSEYFVTATLINISQGNFDKSFYIRPYWVTLDGTEVYGENRYVTVEDGYDSTIINMPVKMSSDPGESLTVSGVSNATVSLANYDGTYAHVRIKLPNNTNRKALDSATKIEVTGADVSGSDVYRNLLTDYLTSGTADTSWYTEYDTEDEFIVATSADLYGLALVVNGTEDITADNFEGKTVYVVSDIVANKLYVDKDNVTYSVKKNAEGQSIEDGTDYKWTRVGDTSAHKFEGKFDGQMHEISGVRFVTQTETNGTPLGFFSYTGSNAVIKNFKLVNSIFQFGSRRQTGSIVGLASGSTIDTVYSDAVVVAKQVSSGGLVGDGNGVTMTNCWFNGKVQNTYNSTSYNMNAGGLIGYVSNSTTIQNSLNSGQIVATSNTHTTPGVGGLVGRVTAGKTLKIDNCLNVGTLSMNVAATAGYGAIVGAANDTAATYGTATFTTTYAASDYCDVAVNATTDASVEMLTVAKIAGTNALSQNTKNLFTYVTDEKTYANESYWAIVPGGTPVLADFAEVAGIEDYQPIDTSWYNKNESEFILKDAADFYGLTMLSRVSTVEGFVDKNIKLAEDIVIPNEGEAADWATTAPEYEWLCIGDYYSSQLFFKGKFNGQGHEISGVYLNGTSAYKGLFGYVGEGAKIRNFRLVNSYFYSTKDQLGSIAGYACGTFENIYSDAIVKVNGGNNVGGLIGRVQGSTSEFTMNNCWYNGSVTNTASTANIGGLIGRIMSTISSATITNCLNTANVSSTVSASPYVGGIVGYSQKSGLTITNCLNTGEITYKPSDDTTTTTDYGLIGGKVSTATITGTYTTNQDGVDYIYNSANADCTLDATTIYGTAAMDKMPELFTLASVDDVMYWAVTDYTPVLASFAEYATDAEGNAISTVAIDTSWYDASKDTYTLYDASDLYGFAMLSKLADVNGFAGKTIKLGADIVIPNAGEAKNWATTAPKYEWTSIGAANLQFNGIFDGQGNEISGVYMNVAEAGNGLFNYVGYDATIQKFSLKNSYFHSTADNFGSIAGRTYGGTFDTIYSDAIVVTSAYNTGGLIGRVQGSSENQAVLEVKNCWFAGSVTNTSSSKAYTGGLVGRIFSQTNLVDSVSIINCLNSGTVSAENHSTPYMGGIYGYNQNGSTTVTNSLNVGKLVYKESDDTTTTTQYGLIGSGMLGSVSNTYTIAQEGVDYRYGAANASYTLDETTIYGTAAMSAMTQLFIPELVDDEYTMNWATVPGSTPVLASFVKYASEGAFVPDTTWYDANESSYTLNDAADLYGFALLSKNPDMGGFEGKKITLAADIDMNEGWEASEIAPEYLWPGIGHYASSSDDIPFKGTFDGGNHTISGIYYNNGTTAYGGLFRKVEGATIKNLSLTNSYITSNRDFLGSITGQATSSSFEQIYSDAIVKGSRQSIGGLIGRISTKGTLTRCWYDGEVTNTGNSTSSQTNRMTGGLIGRVQANNGVTISNCLNTADVSAPNYNYVEESEGTITDEETGETTTVTMESVAPQVGGLIGFLNNGSVTMSYSLNTGKVVVNDAATNSYGALVGRVNSGTTLIVLGDTYATTTSCSTLMSVHANATVTEEVANFVHVVDDTITGDNAEDTALFATENDGVWTTVANSTPVLACFADNATTGVEPTLSNVQTTIMSNAGSVITKEVTGSISLTETRGDVYTRQGGCYVEAEDGKIYYFQAYLSKYFYANPLKPQDYNGDGVENNKDNSVVIVKYELNGNTGTEVARSEEFEFKLYHANDMTYNSKLNLLIVAHANDDMHRISFINPDTLEIVGTKYIDGLSFYSIDYNATYDCYVVQTGESNDVGHHLVMLNADFEVIAEYEDTAYPCYTDPRQTTTGTGAQGMGCDDRYIYCLFSSGTGASIMTVFDWNGNYVTEIAFTVRGEVEAVSIVGNTIYVNVAGESKIYQLVF